MKKIQALVESFSEIKALGLVLAFTVIGPGLGALVLTATSYQWYPWASQNDISPWMMIVIGVVLAGCSLLPTHACSLVAGLLFGPWVGALVALSSVAGASLLGYFLFGKCSGDKPLLLVKKDPKIAEVHKLLLVSDNKKTFMILFLLRLSPLMPFAATNALLSALKVKVKLFLLSGLLGLGPRVLGVVWIGASLKSFDLEKGSHPFFLILGIFATLLLPWFIHRNLKMNAQMDEEGVVVNDDVDTES